MTDAVSDPLLPLFREQASAWLNASASLAHWWTPDAALLDAAVRALQAQAEVEPPGRVTCVFREGDFLALLQRLNGLLAAAQRDDPHAQAHAGQVWILDRADRVSADHLDILRRIGLHYPELQIHLACFSLTAQAPAPSDGVALNALLPVDGDSAQADGKGEERSARSAPARGGRWLMAALLCLAVVVVALLWWPAAQVGVTETPQALQATPVQAGSAAVAPEASSPELPASEASTPDVRSPANERAVSASRRWLLGLPAGTWVVVHAQAASMREAEAFRADKSVLANARILQTSAEGQPPHFLVVTGPFRSPERAQNYILRLEWKSSARSVERDGLLFQMPH